MSQRIKFSMLQDDPDSFDPCEHAVVTNLYYLATPYTKYKDGLHAAFTAAARINGSLRTIGIQAYSPIVHDHSIALISGMDPLDHAIWLPFNNTMMKVCTALIVGRLAGWDTSKGVAHEIETFRAAGKPIFDLDPDSLTMVRRE